MFCRPVRINDFSGWVDYFANVGGLLGLCIGLSIVTIMELVWLCMRLARTAKMKLSQHTLEKPGAKKEAWY